MISPLLENVTHLQPFPVDPLTPVAPRPPDPIVIISSGAFIQSNVTQCSHFPFSLLLSHSNCRTDYRREREKKSDHTAFPFLVLFLFSLLYTTLSCLPVIQLIDDQMPTIIWNTKKRWMCAHFLAHSFLPRCAKQLCEHCKRTFLFSPIPNGILIRNNNIILC